MTDAVHINRLPCPVCGELIEFSHLEKVEWSFPESKVPRAVLTLRSYQGLGANSLKYHWGGVCGEAFAVDPDESPSAQRLDALRRFVEARGSSGTPQSAYIDGDDHPVIRVDELMDWLRVTP